MEIDETSLGIDPKTGLEKRRRFISAELTRTSHKINFQEYIISPNGEKIDIKNTFYESYPDRIEYWNSQLGDNVILPAILLALQGLTLKDGQYWHGTPEE